MFALKLRPGERVRVGDTEIEVTNLRRGHATLSFQGPRDTPIQVVAADKSMEPFVALVRGPGSQGTTFPPHLGIPARADCVLGFDTRPNYVNWPMARQIEAAMAEVWAGAYGRDLVLALDLAPMLAFHIGTTTPATINAVARGHLDANRYSDVHSKPASLLRVPADPAAWLTSSEWMALHLDFATPACRSVSLSWDAMCIESTTRPVSSSLRGLRCDLEDGDSAAYHPAFWPLIIDEFSALIGHLNPDWGGHAKRLFLFLPDDTPPGLAWLLGRRWARKVATFERAELTLVTPASKAGWWPAATYSH